MSKRKLDQTGINYSYKSKQIKKNIDSEHDKMICDKFENDQNSKDKGPFSKTNDNIYEDVSSESSNFIESSPSSDNEICFVYKTTPDNSVCSFTEDEEESEALENDSKVEEKISPLEKIYNESTIVSKSNELRAELEKNYKIIDVEADGNCFFRAVLYCIGRSDKQYQDLRANACDYIHFNKECFSEFQGEGDTEVESWIKNGRNNGVWANSLAILATALMLDICITIFSPGYSFPLKYCPESSSEIFLLNSNRNHFEALIPKKSATNKIKSYIKLNNSKKVDSHELQKQVRHPMREQCYSFPKDGNSVYEDFYMYLSEKVIPSRFLNMPESNELEIKKKTSL